MTKEQIAEARADLRTVRALYRDHLAHDAERRIANRHLSAALDALEQAQAQAKGDREDAVDMHYQCEALEAEVERLLERLRLQKEHGDCLCDECDKSRAALEAGRE